MELHFKASLLLFSVLPLLSLGQLPSNASKSYLSNDSYSQYPPWKVQERGLLQFSFKTSHLNALLLYFDSRDAMFGVGEYFKLSLVNGVLTAETLTSSFEPVRVSIGGQEYLNDNQVHTVQVLHDSSSLHFIIRLDQRAPETVHYEIVFVSAGDITSVLYFGGVPDSFVAVANSIAPTDPHLVGCIMDVRYSNDSVAAGELVEEFPQEEISVIEGCVDRCEGVECGEGVCVPRFPVGICNCRGTNKLGANCTEDPGSHARTFTSEGAYLCYDVLREPHNGEQTEISVKLIPPLPRDGTIITGVSSSGLMYSVSLENDRVVQALSRDGLVVVSARGSLPLSTSSTYRIDAAVNRTHIAFTVNQLQGEVLSEFDRTETAIVPVLSSDPIFEHVCLGGGSLEDKNYVGTIESAFSDYFSLTEEQNFDLFGTNETERSNLINFNGDATLQFQKLHTNAVRFSFDKRTGISTEIFRLQNNSGDVLSLSVFSNSIVALQEDIRCEYNVEDDEWHHFEVFITREPVASINYTVDCNIQCQIASSISTAELESFLSNPIEFARPHESGGGPPFYFEGCLQNFVFEQSNGELLQPNLEVLTRIGNDFSTSIEGCDRCIQEAIACPSTCLNRDFMRGDECNPVDEVSPFKCPALPSFTTTTTTTTAQPTTAPTTPTIPPAVVVDTLEAGTWAGIGIGIVLALILIIVITILGVVLFAKQRAGQGFYKTYETNEKNPQVIHYSASLKELTSEVINVETNGQIPTPSSVQTNGHSKEFYL